MGQSLDGADPRLVEGYMKLSQVCNIKLESGIRTRAEQEALWANRHSNPYPVAAPGTSKHEGGGAIDISGDLACAHREGARFGMVFPYSDDPIHMEVAGGGAAAPVYKGDDLHVAPKADPIARVIAGATAALSYDPDTGVNTSVEGLGAAVGKKPVAPAAEDRPPNAVVATQGGDIDSWIRQAMQITGKDESWFEPLKKKALQESGGRNIPQGITDINTQKGTPAFGPMQVIEPTFNSNKLPGYDNWKDPVHNIIAAIRYIDARYGGDIQGVARRGGGY